MQESLKNYSGSIIEVLTRILRLLNSLFHWKLWFIWVKGALPWFLSALLSAGVFGSKPHPKPGRKSKVVFFSQCLLHPSPPGRYRANAHVWVSAHSVLSQHLLLKISEQFVNIHQLWLVIFQELVCAQPGEQGCENTSSSSCLPFVFLGPWNGIFLTFLVLSFRGHRKQHREGQQRDPKTNILAQPWAVRVCSPSSALGTMSWKLLTAGSPCSKAAQRSGSLGLQRLLGVCPEPGSSSRPLCPPWQAGHVPHGASWKAEQFTSSQGFSSPASQHSEGANSPTCQRLSQGYVWNWWSNQTIFNQLSPQEKECYNRPG